MVKAGDFSPFLQARTQALHCAFHARLLLGKAQPEMAFAALAEGAAGSDRDTVLMHKSQGEGETIGKSVETDEGVEGPLRWGDADAIQAGKALHCELPTEAAVLAKARHELGIRQSGKRAGLGEGRAAALGNLDHLGNCIPGTFRNDHPA